MQTIRISEVFAQLNAKIKDNGEVNTFSIAFVRIAKGAKRGTICEVKRARKDSVVKTIEGTGANSGKIGYNLKSNRSTIVYDLDQQRSITVKIDYIIKFNGKRVIH
jgi:hypothetical protein